MSLPSRFEDLPLLPELLQAVAEIGYKTMTPIQARAIPLLLEGHDLIGQSRTGSGKTAAFTLPLLQYLEPDAYPQALVLCPTRELCTQVAREVRKLGRHLKGLQVLILAGGQPIGPQIAALEKGVHVIVGTPGRMLDHVNRRSIDFRKLQVLVLDEADRMLEMGFQEDMEKILAATPEERQTILFSATFPPTIEAMSRAYQHEPERVTVDPEEKAPSTIRQLVCEIDPEKRYDALKAALSELKPEAAIIFCNFKASVADLASRLERDGTSVAALSGDLEQRDRDRVLAKFRNRSIRVLVATDVAARGLDIEDLDLVVNYELPQQPEIYVHRIGRTGRAGREGTALAFHSAKEKPKLEALEKFTGEKLQRKSWMTQATPATLAAPAAMQTLFISGGRKDKMRPGDILGALTGEAGGLDSQDVGKIEIHDRFSYVAVSAHLADTAIERLRAGRIKGKKFRIEPVK